jgi:hypothetical protein
MPRKRQIQFSAVIKAPADVVWHHVTHPASYRHWASAFAEGSCYAGSWESGAKILFLSPSGDGMVAHIAELRLNEFISIRHVGFITQGVEDTSSDAVRAWAPATEKYTFLATADGTTLIVDQEIAAEWEEPLSQSWPKALARLTALCESGDPA